MDINNNFSSPATPQTQMPKPKSRLALVLASILTLGLVAALFSGTLTNLFRGALIPFNGMATQQVDVKYIPLTATPTPVTFNFSQIELTRLRPLIDEDVYFGQKFTESFRNIDLALFEQTATTPTELDPAIPHKFEVSAPTLAGAENIEVLALMVDAEAYEKVFASTFVADAAELCESQTDGSNDCQKYLEEMVKDADFVRFFNLTATNPTHELILPRFLTQETPALAPASPVPTDATLLGSYSKNTDFSKPRKLVLINSNNSIVSKYLAKRVEIDQENLTLNYCPLPEEPIVNGLTIEGANGLKLSNFGTFKVTEDEVCTSPVTDLANCDPIAEFNVRNELELGFDSFRLVSEQSDKLFITVNDTPYDPTTGVLFSAFAEIKVYVNNNSTPINLVTVPFNSRPSIGRAPTDFINVNYIQGEENLVYFSYPSYQTVQTEFIGSYQIKLRNKPSKDVFVKISSTNEDIEYFSSLDLTDLETPTGTPLLQDAIKFTPDSYNNPQTVYFKVPELGTVRAVELVHNFEFGIGDPSDFDQFIGFLIDTLNTEAENTTSVITANVLDIKFKENSTALTPQVSTQPIGVIPSVETDSWLEFNIDAFKPGTGTNPASLTRTKLNFSNINQKFFEDGVNNVYTELVNNPAACEAFESSNTAFALTTANKIKDELVSKKQSFDTLSFLSASNSEYTLTEMLSPEGTLTETAFSKFKVDYLKQLYLNEFVFDKTFFGGVSSFVEYENLPNSQKTPQRIGALEQVNEFFEGVTVTATGSIILDPSVRIPDFSTELNNLSSKKTEFETQIRIFSPVEPVVYAEAITQINDKLAELVEYQTSAPATLLEGLSVSEQDYLTTQLRQITARLRTESEGPLVKSGKVNFFTLEQSKFDIDRMLQVLDAQIARLNTISSFCTSEGETSKTTVLANILNEVILGDKKDNISINMPITTTNVPAVIEIDRSALNEIRASYKNASETQQIEFAAINNGVGYNSFNKLVFTYGAYRAGHLSPTFEFSISRFFDPQPPTVFTGRELFDNAVRFLTKTNLQAVDYINPTLNTSYVSLNSNYPKVKDFLSMGAAYFDANNYSFADFTTFNDTTSNDQGVLVYAATKRNVQPAGTCSASAGSDSSVSEDTQFYIIPYKLVGTAPVTPPVDPEPDPTPDPVAGPACTVTIDATSVPLNKEFIVNYNISSPVGFNFTGKQIRLVRTPNAGIDDAASFIRIRTDELSGNKTFIIPRGSQLIDYTFSIQVASDTTYTPNLCSTNTTDLITATAEVTGGGTPPGGGGSTTPPGGSGGGSTPPRTRGAASTQGYCRPGATLVDDYIIRDNDLISEAITFNYNEGIFTGKPNPERRCPKNIIDLRSNLNRIEAAKVTTTLASKFDAAVSRLAQDRWSLSDGNFGYRDLNLSAPDNAWMQDIVKLAFRTKLFTGYGDSTFRPANSISYAEFMKVILLATNNASLDDFRISQYNANGQPWYTGVMAIARDKYKLTTLDPNQPLTRGNAIVIIYELESKGLYN